MTKVNWKVLLPGLALVLPLVAILASGFGNDPHALPSMLEGRAAPTFALQDLDGAPHTLEGLRGEPVVLNFWSTWCGPCKFEHPLLLQAAGARPDIHFLGVIYSDEPGAVRRYLARAGSAFPHLVDDGNKVAIDYGVAGVPETFFIDRQGVIVYKHVGPLDPGTLQSKLTEISRP